MAIDNSQSKEVDLDRTDKLPILEGVSRSTRTSRTTRCASSTSCRRASRRCRPDAQPSDFARPPGSTCPRSPRACARWRSASRGKTPTTKRCNRLYEKARDAQLAAGTRADTLASELAAAQSALAVEQHRVARDGAGAGGEPRGGRCQPRPGGGGAARNGAPQTEARTLRDSLAARDATIAQVLHSLGERDAQLHALQREHAQIVPDARGPLAGGRAARIGAAGGARPRRVARSGTQGEPAVALRADGAAQARRKSELAASRRDLIAAKAQADAYLETLRTREWRGGFNQNLFREWDAEGGCGAQRPGRLAGGMRSAAATIAALNAKLLEHDDTVAKMQAAAAADAATFAKKAQELQDGQRARAELHSRIDESGGGAQAARGRARGARP